MNTKKPILFLPNGHRSYHFERFFLLRIGSAFAQFLKRQIGDAPDSFVLGLASFFGLLASVALFLVPSWGVALWCTVAFLLSEILLYSVWSREASELPPASHSSIGRWGKRIHTIEFAVIYLAIFYRLAIDAGELRIYWIVAWTAIVGVAILQHLFQGLLSSYFHEVYAFWVRGHLSAQLSQAIDIRIANASGNGGYKLGERIRYARRRVCENLTPRLQQLLSFVYRKSAQDGISASDVAKLQNDAKVMIDALMPLSFSFRLLLLLVALVLGHYWIFLVAESVLLFLWLWGVHLWYAFRCKGRLARIKQVTDTHRSSNDSE